MSLPADWRERFVAMVRGDAAPEPEWFAGGPFLTPEQQVEVYREQHRMRLFDAVVEEVRGLCALLSDDVRDALLSDYLRDCPSTSWTLNRVADALPGWLAARDVPRPWIEMAALDLAVSRGFEAADGHPLTPDDLADLPPLALRPHVTLLRHTTSVHRYRAAVLADRDPDPLEEGDFPLVVFRRERGMRHWRIDPDAWRLLSAIGDGATLGDALDAVVSAGADPERIAPEIGGWFRDFVARGIVGRAG